MYLNRILISNFKNIKEADIRFSKKINCIWGNNGEGKTNLLDAIYYLSTTKSFFHSSDTYTFKFNENSTALNGSYITDCNTEEKISIGIKIGSEKIVKRNDKQYQRLADHIGLIPIVMVSPADTCLINEGGDERRKFMNIILSQVDREYLKRIQNYNQLLVQRNRLLKMQDISMELLDTLGMQMDSHATYIYDKRKQLCQELSESVMEFYKVLSGSKETISLKFTSDLDKGKLANLFATSFERDMFLRYTSIGIQRDDIEFNMEGYPIRKCGSQGQQKSFLISLKLAQFVIMKKLHGIIPILLLDDVFDKLDMQRVEYLLNLVANDSFGQIFISDSNKVRMAGIVERIKSSRKSFEVKAGVYNEVEENVIDGEMRKI
ncbi:MAG: DNA replication and repair protein RecF [Bacteroidales bacterium]